MHNTISNEGYKVLVNSTKESRQLLRDSLQAALQNVPKHQVQKWMVYFPNGKLPMCFIVTMQTVVEMMVTIYHVDQSFQLYGLISFNGYLFIFQLNSMHDYLIKARDSNM